MGIKGFYNKWFVNRRNKKDQSALGNRPEVVSTVKPPLVSCLFFDLNSLIHNAAGKVYCYAKPDKKSRDYAKEKAEYDKRYVINSQKTDEELEILHHQEVCMMIYNQIKQFNPQDYVVLAVDGVAPMAKITQQRSRRYKKAQDNTPPPTPEQPLELRFDSNSITPGTDFMFRLDASIQIFLRDAVRDAHFQVKHIVYSSHLTPGEGEHKIFDVLRKPDNGVVPGDGNNIVIGADADLFMLSLLSKTPYLIIYREADNEKVFIDIDRLRMEIFNRMTAYGVIETPQQIVIQDFVLLFFTIGNDFLPHILSYDDVKDSMTISLNTYISLGLPLTDETGQILWENYLRFMKKIANKEQGMLENIVKNTNWSVPYEALNDASTRVFIKENVIEGTYEEAEDSVVYKVDMKKLGEGWYSKVFSPRHPDSESILKKFKCEYLLNNTEEYIREMCMEYFKGMQWIMRYYLFGHSAVSSQYIFVYHYAPLLQDMYRVLNEAISSEASLPTINSIASTVQDPVISPIHQLMMVQPVPSLDLIPGKFRYLMFDSLRDICPIGFMIDPEGRRGDKTYTDLAILTIVDPKRVINEAMQFPIPKKYGIEKTKFIMNATNKKIPFIPMNLKELQKFEELQNKKMMSRDRTKPKPSKEAIVQEEIEDVVEEAIQDSITDVVVPVKYVKPEKPGYISLNWNAKYVM